MLFHFFRRYFTHQKRIIFRAQRNYAYIGSVTFIAGACMSDL
jgi:hypothetical protein